MTDLGVVRTLLILPYSIQAIWSASNFSKNFGVNGVVSIWIEKSLSKAHSPSLMDGKRKMGTGPKLGDEMSVLAISARLKLLREAMDWSQTVMAGRVGVQLSTWNNYELAVSPIPWRTALKVCSVTGASLDWIYRNERGLMPVNLMDKIEELAAAS